MITAHWLRKKKTCIRKAKTVDLQWMEPRGDEKIDRETEKQEKEYQTSPRILKITSV